MTRFLLSTIKGCEDLTQRELNRLGYSTIKVLQGKLIVEGKKNNSLVEDIIRLNWMPKTVERVNLILTQSKIAELSDFNSLVQDAAELLKHVMPLRASFAVKTARSGKHSFTSIDVNKVVGSEILKLFSASNPLRVDLNHPTIILRVWIENNEAFLTIDTTGKDSLRKRRYMTYAHPAPIRTTIAAAMLEKIKYNGENLTDPFCGGGTILIEAAHRVRKIPNMAFRDTFAFYHLKSEEIRATAHEIAMELVEKMNNTAMSLNGIEIEKNHAFGAYINTKKAFVSDTVRIINGDALKEPLGEPHYIVSNPPFGVRLKNGMKDIELYQRFATRIKEFSDVELLLLTYKKLILKAFSDFKILELKKISYGAFYVYLAHIKT